VWATDANFRDSFARSGGRLRVLSKTFLRVCKLMSGVGLAAICMAASATSNLKDIRMRVALGVWIVETQGQGEFPEPQQVVAPFEKEMPDWFGTPEWFVSQRDK
jgi:hypothetical protein